MFLQYNVVTTFAVAVVLSFTVSVMVLLVMAARRGLLRVGAGSRNSKITTSSLLLPPSALPNPTSTMPKNIEMSPLSPQFV